MMSGEETARMNELEENKMKNFLDELTEYRVKVERDGKEILNVPGILALPAALIAPKMSIIGTIAASLLGCSIHLEGSDGKEVDVGEKVRKTAETVAETAENVAKTVREEVEKAWESVSADYPEECPVGEENEENGEIPEDGIPSIEVKPEDPEKAE